MTYQSFPYPSPEPLERLRVHDNLTINAKRWLLAHEYHNNRQNVVYQSLHQPGIIHGLGVKVIDPPKNVSERAKERQWFEIQPGIAIDIWGNPIIVNSKTNFPLPISIPKAGNQVICIILKHFVAPNELEHSSLPDEVVELFRLDGINRLPRPEAGEIELCRIELSRGMVNLEIPENPLFPKVNQIDLNYRVQAQYRPLAGVKIGSFNQSNENLKALLESLPALFPSLQATVGEEVVNININNSNIVNSHDLFYLTFQNVSSLSPASLDILRSYLEDGGVILIELSPSDSDWQQRLQSFFLSASEHFMSWEDLIYQNHPLSRKPFLFTELPSFYEEQINIQISQNGKLIVATEGLLNAWRGMWLPRQDIRVAHELGINILHYAWQQRYFYQLLH